MPAAQPRRAPLFLTWDERYRVVRRIGAGGFATVYEAVDLETDLSVAMKVIEEQGAVGQRVLREVEAAQTLDHPGIVALLDFFSDGERSFLVWELVQGESLAVAGESLRDRDALAAIAQVFEAIAYAHSMGVVHRDIKPANVMIDDAGEIKVMDFGIAQLSGAETLTAEGEMIGTVAYMSPEQAASRRVGPPTDVYSAGVLLYELLAGRNPLRGATAAETLGNVLAARLPSLRELRPDLPRELTDLVDGCCDATPARRPTAADVALSLHDLAGRVRGRRFDAQRLAAPFTRLGSLGERASGAVLAGLTAWAVAGWLPAYPDGWRLPLAVSLGALWFVLPRLGLAALLGSLAFPLFNISLGAGAVYLAFAVAAFLLARRRPLGFLWGTLALALLPLHAVLVAPAAAALVFGRRRGPLVAAWAGAATYFAVRISADADAPFAVYQTPDALARRFVRAGGVFDVVDVASGALVVWPLLFQMLVWAGLALGIALAAGQASVERRLWVWAGSFAAAFIAYRVVTVVVWDLPAPPGRLALDVTVAALLTLVPVVVGRVAGAAPDAAGDADDEYGGRRGEYAGEAAVADR
jgi:hypothetical protein